MTQTSLFQPIDPENEAFFRVFRPGLSSDNFDIVNSRSGTHAHRLLQGLEDL